MKAQIVCGASLGDEGKGMTVDFLSSLDDDSIVVRFNGGANAGHTVETDTTRHVFSHFGSGTLTGKPTFLSKYFIVDPEAFLLELYELLSYPDDVKPPLVYVDGNALLSTPIDSTINVAVEQSRGNDRHGSCGFGINETVTRNNSKDPEFNALLMHTTVNDIIRPDILRAKLKYIRDNYMPKRLKELGISSDVIVSDESLDFFISYCEQLKGKVVIVSGASVILNYNTVVFEGAQGLLLDEYHRWFPHVTRSRTGVFNAVQILKSIGVYEADVFYVTRSYLTRHGNGPLPFEDKDGDVFKNVVDLTNKPNAHQGTIRYAPLNLQLLSESITNDIRTVTDFVLHPHLVVTCVNQIPTNNYCVDVNGHIIYVPSFALRKTLETVYPFEVMLFSDGKTRKSFLWV